MAVTARLEQRLGQTLVMTPQLRQAIKLLQLSNLELSAYVEQEVEKNPLLERAEAEGPVVPDPLPADAPARDAATANAPADSAEMAASDQLPGGEDEPLDADYGNVYEPDGVAVAAGDGLGAFGPTAYGRGGSSDFEAGGELEEFLTREKTLREHLEDQLMVEIADAGDRLIGLHLIDLLDEAGYLGADLEPVAAALDCEPARIEAVLARLQGFDPPGVFARSLRECLALQLADRDRLDPAMAALLDHLELLARRDFAGLRACCGVDEEDLAEMVAEIKSLDPKPGFGFERELVQTVVPDVLVRARPDGGWSVELNSDTLPRVLVNQRYCARVSGLARSKADKAYLSDQLQSANWLARALDQRANTILRVATELVRRQEGFLTHGVRHLRPLTLRDVAEQLEMHESTISRVTANKYMATPRGIFELKYFFTSAIASHTGEALSAEAVRHRIKDLIGAEQPKAVLSDDKIVEILRGEGIDIARRTVAKYRETMRIPSSLARRRAKAAGL